MSESVEGFRFQQPGPSTSASTTEKINWPRETTLSAVLQDYPSGHEVFAVRWSTNTRLYDGHNTKIFFKWYNNKTNELLSEYTLNIPNPGLFGWTYWINYRGYTWLSHSSGEIDRDMEISCEISQQSSTLPGIKWVKIFIVTSETPGPPEVICTPGEQRCLGDDLYRCNAAGTDWTLLTKNASVCKKQSSCPDFWVDPVGAVVCWILNAFESAFNLVSGGFYTLIGNVKNFLSKYSTDIVDFISDIPGNIVDAVGDTFAKLSEIPSLISDAIGEWWSSASKNLHTWLSNSWSSLNDFWSDITSHIGSWWDSTSHSVRSWIDDAVSSVKDFIDTGHSTLSSWWTSTWSNVKTWVVDRWTDIEGFWNDITSKIGEWWNDTKKTVWDGLNSVVRDISEYFTSGFTDFIAWVEDLPGTVADFVGSQISGLQDFITDLIPQVVESMFEWAKPIIKPIQDAVKFLEQISHIFTGSYKDTEEYKKRQQTIKEKQEKIREIVRRL